MREYRFHKMNTFKRDMVIKNEWGEEVGSITYKNNFCNNSTVTMPNGTWKLKKKDWYGGIDIIDENGEYIGKVTVNSWTGKVKMTINEMEYSFTQKKWSSPIMVFKDFFGIEIMTFKYKYHYKNKEMASVRIPGEIDEKHAQIMMAVGWHLLYMRMQGIYMAA